MNEINVNDGKGFYDSDGLIDTLIVDCNNLTKHLASGQYAQYCNTIVGMIQKLSQLKEGIRKEIADRDQTIADMRDAENDPAVTEEEI